jgi:hypothetical protein
MSVSGNLFGQILFISGIVLMIFGLDRSDHAIYTLAGAVLTGASYLGLVLGEGLSRITRKSD